MLQRCHPCHCCICRCVGSGGSRRRACAAHALYVHCSLAALTAPFPKPQMSFPSLLRGFCRHAYLIRVVCSDGAVEPHGRQLCFQPRYRSFCCAAPHHTVCVWSSLAFLLSRSRLDTTMTRRQWFFDHVRCSPGLVRMDCWSCRRPRARSGAVPRGAHGPRTGPQVRSFLSRTSVEAWHDWRWSLGLKWR